MGFEPSPWCARPGCCFRRHTKQNHGFCCKFCKAGRGHGPKCERVRRAPGDDAEMERCDDNDRAVNCHWRQSHSPALKSKETYDLISRLSTPRSRKSPAKDLPIQPIGAKSLELQRVANDRLSTPRTKVPRRFKSVRSPQFLSDDDATST